MARTVLGKASKGGKGQHSVYLVSWSKLLTVQKSISGRLPVSIEYKHRYGPGRRK
jgi:hypothetical protein